MEIFSINLIVEDVEPNKNIREAMKKVLRVIKSMNSREQIDATRKYIDLWYKSKGEAHKKLIELYFKTKKQTLN